MKTSLETKTNWNIIQLLTSMSSGPHNVQLCSTCLIILLLQRLKKKELSAKLFWKLDVDLALSVNY